MKMNESPPTAASNRPKLPPLRHGLLDPIHAESHALQHRASAPGSIGADVRVHLLAREVRPERPHRLDRSRQRRVPLHRRHRSHEKGDARLPALRGALAPTVPQRVLDTGRGQTREVGGVHPVKRLSVQRGSRLVEAGIDRVGKVRRHVGCHVGCHVGPLRRREDPVASAAPRGERRRRRQRLPRRPVKFLGRSASQQRQRWGVHAPKRGVHHRRQQRRLVLQAVQERLGRVVVRVRVRHPGGIRDTNRRGRSHPLVTRDGGHRRRRRDDAPLVNQTKRDKAGEVKRDPRERSRSRPRHRAAEESRQRDDEWE
mmetsp:Transcript_11073/g.50186  ORF Transcript_11073/g.50186 Transcript_11073/m.50186 type:complete len:313 (+) Transcript_11073:17-955(+)